MAIGLEKDTQGITVTLYQVKDHQYQIYPNTAPIFIAGASYSPAMTDARALQYDSTLGMIFLPIQYSDRGEYSEVLCISSSAGQFALLTKISCMPRTEPGANTVLTNYLMRAQRCVVMGDYAYIISSANIVSVHLMEPQVMDSLWYDTQLDQLIDQYHGLTSIPIPDAQCTLTPDRPVD